MTVYVLATSSGGVLATSSGDTSSFSMVKVTCLCQWCSISGVGVPGLSGATDKSPDASSKFLRSVVSIPKLPQYASYARNMG
jgi:hypothetical protein